MDKLLLLPGSPWEATTMVVNDASEQASIELRLARQRQPPATLQEVRAQAQRVMAAEKLGKADRLAGQLHHALQLCTAPGLAAQAIKQKALDAYKRHLDERSK